MRQYSREKQAVNELQRNGLFVVNQAQVPLSNMSTIKSLGYDTMTINKPIFSQTQPPPKQQATNLTHYYQPQKMEEPNAYSYKPEQEYNQQMQAFILNRNDELGMPIYQSLELQRKPTDLRPYDNNRSFVGQKNLMYDSLSSLAQKHNIAQKTPEQIVNEFKAYTLPKLRLKRFIKMQALMKGYHVRRFKIPRMKQRFQLYRMIAEEMLRNAISDKFVPDIVLEVITYNKHNQDLSLYSDKHRVFIKYIDDILFRVVKKLSREVVKEQTDYLVTSIMNKRFQDKPQGEKDPLKLLTLVFIGRFIEKEVFVYAKECIRDMSLDYFRDLQYTQIIKETLIPNTVQYVVFDALDEIIVERYLDQVINNLTKELSNPLASHMYELIVAEQESYSLDLALQNYMYRMMGDVLLEHILLQLQNEQGYDLVPGDTQQNDYNDEELEEPQDLPSKSSTQQRQPVPSIQLSAPQTKPLPSSSRQQTLQSEPQKSSKSSVPQSIQKTQRSQVPEPYQKSSRSQVPQPEPQQVSEQKLDQQKPANSQDQKSKSQIPNSDSFRKSRPQSPIPDPQQKASGSQRLQTDPQQKTSRSQIPQPDTQQKFSEPLQTDLQQKTSRSQIPQPDLQQKQSVSQPQLTDPIEKTSRSQLPQSDPQQKSPGSQLLQSDPKLKSSRSQLPQPDPPLKPDPQQKSSNSRDKQPQQAQAQDDPQQSFTTSLKQQQIPSRSNLKQAESQGAINKDDK